MIPTSRCEFKSYCLRDLGAPVIEINVADEQVEDRIDEALSFFGDYHFDGSAKTFYKHMITQEDKDNKYITIPENIFGAVRIFEFGGWGATSANDIFNINYQIALNDLYSLTSTSLVSYYLTMEKLDLMQEMLVGKKPIRYERHRNRVYVDMNWDMFKVGQFLIVEAYEVVDPELFCDVWKDRWLFKYATALIKKNWGSNLTKYNGMQMPGGLTFNGDRILSDAQQEIRELEEKIITDFSIPPEMYYG